MSEDDRDLSGEERRALEALPREADPPADLEDRIVAELRQSGHLRPARAGRGRRAVIAAGVFLAGVAVGMLGQRWIGFGGGRNAPAGGALFLLLLYRTRLGIATRAVSQQPIASQLCGISILQVNVLTFVVTGMLGGIAGAMSGAAIGMLSPLLAQPLTVKGLIVTVIGGLGSIPGAIIAGLIVGGLESLFQFLRGVTERDLYIMMLLFAFLVFRPGGIFAKAPGRD